MTDTSPAEAARQRDVVRILRPIETTERAISGPIPSIADDVFLGGVHQRFAVSEKLRCQRPGDGPADMIDPKSG